MSDEPYIPDLDEAGFRILIDARKMVMIRFQKPDCAVAKDMLPLFYEAAARHHAVSFAQSDMREHPKLALRAMVERSPTTQGWVNGNLLFSREGYVTFQDMEQMIAQMSAKSGWPDL